MCFSNSSQWLTVINYHHPLWLSAISAMINRHQPFSVIIGPSNNESWPLMDPTSTTSQNWLFVDVWSTLINHILTDYKYKYYDHQSIFSPYIIYQHWTTILSPWIQHFHHHQPSLQLNLCLHGPTLSARTMVSARLLARGRPMVARCAPTFQWLVASWWLVMVLIEYGGSWRLMMVTLW